MIINILYTRPAFANPCPPPPFLFLLVVLLVPGSLRASDGAPKPSFPAKLIRLLLGYVALNSAYRPMQERDARHKRCNTSEHKQRQGRQLPDSAWRGFLATGG